MIKTVRIRVAGNHDYNIEVIEDDHSTNYSLYYSDNPAWNFPNDFIISIIDNGSGFVVGDIDKDLDYQNAHELYILLAYVHKSANIFDKLEVEIVTTKEL